MPNFPSWQAAGNSIWSRPMRLYALLLIPVLLVTGCSSNVKQRRVERGPRVVRVDWLGHNCFLLTSSIGIKLLTDPFNPKFTRYAKPEGLRSDIILVSHENNLVNNTDLVVNSPQVFRSASGMGSNRASGILIRGLPTYPNPGAPNILGMNMVYVWTMDGVRFCHLGSLKDGLPVADARAIGDVDVLFMPVGGEGNLTDKKRQQIVDQLRPSIIVPMGFRSGTGGVHGKVVQLGSRSFDVSKADLPAETTILIPASR